jgi:hypothetical protein
LVAACGGNRQPGQERKKESSRAGRGSTVRPWPEMQRQTARARPTQIAAVHEGRGGQIIGEICRHIAIHAHGKVRHSPGKQTWLFSGTGDVRHLPLGEGSFELKEWSTRVTYPEFRLDNARGTSWGEGIQQEPGHRPEQHARRDADAAGESAAKPRGGLATSLPGFSSFSCVLFPRILEILKDSG